MKTIFTLLSLLFPVSGLYAADLTAYLIDCSKVEPALKRLECYDALASAAKADAGGAGKAAVRNTVTGKWKVEAARNTADDTKTVTMILGSELGKTNWGEPIIFVLRCKSGVPSAYISWNEYLSDAPVEVALRIGAGEAQTRKWSLSTDSKASFYPGKFHELAAALLKSDMMTATTVPLSGKPLAAIFDLRGLTRAMAPLRDACGGLNPKDWAYYDAAAPDWPADAAFHSASDEPAPAKPAAPRPPAKVLGGTGL